MSSNHLCAWCHPGAPGNHGICERHARELRREAARLRAGEAGEAESIERGPDGRWWERAERAGKHYDQLVFSVLVLVAMAGLALLGVIVGVGVATWRHLAQ